MSWQDSIGSLAGTLGTSASWNSLPRQTQTYQQKLSTYGYDYGSHNATWSNLASGRLAPAVGTPKPVNPAMAPPAKFDVRYPTSYGQGVQPVEPPQGGQDNPIFGAIGSTASNLNLANVVPWFMERVGVLAHEAANSGIPVVSEAGGLVSHPLDLFADGVKAASDAIAPWLNAFPDYVRDGQLHDRSKVYQALVNGESIDWGANGGGLLGTGLFAGPIGNPIEAIAQLNADLNPFDFSHELGAITGQGDPRIRGSVSAQANALNEYRDVLLNSVDPGKRLSAQKGLELLREAIDIPHSVKIALEMKPGANDEDIQKALDMAPEGRAWSYRAGPEGVGLNLATPLLFYIAEARAAGSVASSVGRAGGGLAWAGSGSSSLALQAAGVAGQGIGLAGRGVSIAAAMQKWAFRAGVGTTILTTTADAVARTVGAQAAVDWFDKVNRTTMFSDDPNVQLVTSFSVNPLDGSKAAGKGILRLAHGAGDIAIGAVAGRKLMKFYTSDSLINGMVRRMYRLDSDEAAAAVIDDPAHFPSRGAAADRVMKMATEDHLRTLRPEERAHIVALPAKERTEYALRTYITPILRLLTEDPDGVVARWQLKSAEHHNYVQGYDPEVALRNGADYDRAASSTQALRSDLDAVVGYRETLPPEGQALSRGALDSMTDEAGTIATRGVNGVNGLINDFPVLRNYWQGKITTETRVPRATVERMIDEAQADYEALAHANPIRARTGRDPVLRPSSPSRQRDIADAVNTNIDTIRAIEDFDVANAADVALAKRFLVERGVYNADTAEALTAKQAMDGADAYLLARIAPWQATGKAVETAERALADLRTTAATMRREGRHGAAKIVDAEAAQMARVIAEAGDPLRPFAIGESLVRGTRFSPDVMRRAVRKVDARVRLGVVDSLRTRLSEIELDLGDLRNVIVAADGTLGWAPDLRASPPQALLDAFVRFKTSGPYNTIRKTVGHYNAKHTEEILTARAQAFVDVAEQGTPAQQWQAIGDSPGFLAWLRKQGDKDLEALGGDRFTEAGEAITYPSMTANAMADLVESQALARGQSARTLSQVAEAMGVEPNVALGKLNEMQRAYKDALGGRTEASLRQTRDRIKVSDDAVAQAEADMAVREAVFDAEYESSILPTVIAKVAEITANPTDTALWSALRALRESDATVESGLDAVAARAGVSVDDILADASHADASHADAVRAELVPPDFVPPEPGVIREETALDAAIRNGDDLTVAGLAKKFEENPPRPVRAPKDGAATLAKRIPKLRRSYRYANELDNLGIRDDVAPAQAILDDPRNALGLDVMSILNYGIMGTRPQTLGGVIEILRLIENRHASAVGIGTGMAAEAQRVAKRILDDAIGTAKREVQYEAGVTGTIGPGIRGVDHMELAEGMTRLLKYDDSNPLATLQYGLKKRPKDAVVLEMSTVPGLAEELMTGNYKPFQERVWTAQVRQVYNYVFGPTSNATLRAKTKVRFAELAAARGVDVKFANDLYDTWQRESQTSRSFRMGKNAAGYRAMELGDNPMYADVWNIPNDRLNVAAHGTLGGEVKGLIAEMSSGPNPKIDSATAKAYREVDFADLFRTAGSATKRGLQKVDEKLGTGIAGAYGQVAHHKAVTTLYFMFRFGLDIRFHAQNFFEAQILGLGMAGFRKREVAFGEFGMDSNYLHHLDSEPAILNTGYPLSRSRHQTAYNVFLRMRGDPLRRASKGLATEDPALMQKALEQVRHEPVTADMIAGIKADPDDFIRELDTWHAKMLDNVSKDEDAKVIDQAIADAMKESPELAEVLQRLGETNKGTWDDIRQTIYGNPDRSRAERVLNSYWLYWPLSYQIKSAKWFAKVLFDSAGGLKTNAGGAWLFDQMATTHQQQLQTNPEYQAWFEKHQSLVFMAQMLFPVSFEGVGVSLNPFLRNLFFGSRKEVAGVGPIYTWEGVVKPVVKETYVDLYPVFGDYLMQNTGQLPSKAQQAAVGKTEEP